MPPTLATYIKRFERLKGGQSPELRQLFQYMKDVDKSNGSVFQGGDRLKFLVPVQEEINALEQLSTF